MKKIALGAFLVLLLTIGFGVYYLLSNLNGIVKTAIETYGSQATQTAVRVKSVQIKLQDGSGAIRGLTVGNPQGFVTKLAFSLGEITTQVDLKSLSEDVTVIEHVTVRAPEIFFELNAKGKNNLGELKRNLSSATSKSAVSSSGKGSQTDPRLIIHKLLFVDGNIHASVAPLNKSYELQLPKIVLKNLGGRNGATPTQIANQVLKVLTDRALDEVKKKGIGQYKAKLEGEINKRLGSGKDKLGDKLKGVLGY